jgi:hypothetical protein
MENFEDIKEGGIYDVRIVVEQKRDHALLACALSDAEETNKPRFVFYERTVSDFRQVTPENGIKNTEPAPKYDPCRKFRKGDKVRVVEYKGRNYTNVDTGKEGVVSRNETGADPAIEVVFDDDDLWDVDPAYLELVTPAEEHELYYVEDVGNAWAVRKSEDCGMYSTQAWFSKKRHPRAKEAAEAECDRLNAAYRKEMEK